MQRKQIGIVQQTLCAVPCTYQIISILVAALGWLYFDFTTLRAAR